MKIDNIRNYYFLLWVRRLPPLWKCPSSLSSDCSISFSTIEWWLLFRILFYSHLPYLVYVENSWGAHGKFRDPGLHSLLVFSTIGIWEFFPLTIYLYMNGWMVTVDFNCMLFHDICLGKRVFWDSASLCHCKLNLVHNY